MSFSQEGDEMDLWKLRENTGVGYEDMDIKKISIVASSSRVSCACLCCLVLVSQCFVAVLMVLMTLASLIMSAVFTVACAKYAKHTQKSFLKQYIAQVA